MKIGESVAENRTRYLTVLGYTYCKAFIKIKELYKIKEKNDWNRLVEQSNVNTLETSFKEVTFKSIEKILSQYANQEGLHPKSKSKAFFYLAKGSSNEGKEKM